jgi:hypothetical protein
MVKAVADLQIGASWGLNKALNIFFFTGVKKEKFIKNIF